MRLLSLADQPEHLREAYELVADFVQSLRQPSSLADADLDDEQSWRAGYLIMAADLIAGATMHESWKALMDSLRVRREKAAAPTSGVILLRAEPRPNPLDELAQLWGLRRGLDTVLLCQIVREGSC